MPGIVSEDNRQTDTGYCIFLHYCNGNFNIQTIVSFVQCALVLPAVEAERVNPGPVCTDSSSATGGGLFLGGLSAGALGVLLIVGIVGGACLLRSKHK